jgi:hypothetical protein
MSTLNFYILPAVTGPMGANMPEIPTGIPWVGVYDTTLDDFLIATPDSLTGVSPLTATDLQTQAGSRGLNLAEIQFWRC